MSSRARFSIRVAVVLVLAASAGGFRQQEKESDVVHDIANNPLLVEWNTPFGVPPFDEIEDEHYLPAFRAAMAAHLAEVDAIV
ncbi:MAG: hypothetical protein JSW67_09330, partial [Candidatus Latescibacterota bacterium]